LTCACSSAANETKPATPTSQQSSAAIAKPASGEYRSAIELATKLDQSGFPCDPREKGGSPKSTFAECTVPSFAKRDPLHFTVWNTSELATAGIKAAIKYNQTLVDISGGPIFVVVGENWMIDIGKSRDTADQVATILGGQVRSTI